MLAHFKNIGIETICVCVPSTKKELFEYAPNLINEKQAKRFAKATGFSKLAISQMDVTTSDLCQKAGEYLFCNSNISRDDIDGLIFVTQTPDWTLPATSHSLQYKLNLRNDIVCFDINEGCSGYEQGLYLAANLIASGQCKKILLLAGDTISKITNPEDRATRLIFGDAGTASVISEIDCDLFFNIHTYGDRYKAIITKNSRHRLSDDDKDAFLSLDGLGVMDFTLNEVPDNINELLSYIGITKEDVSLFACHQANKAILEALADKIGVDRNKIPFVAGETGNTSSASIPVLLCQEELILTSNTMLCGFGVGLASAICLTDLSKTEILGVIKYE